MNLRNQRAALFARYSSKMQDELSLDAQISEMERYCHEKKWEVTHRFLLPETRSCNVERSEEFQAMIAEAKRKAFDVLVLHKLDRFGRDRETAIVNKGMLRRLGIHIHSVTERLGESPMELAMEGIMEVMSEWTSNNLGQETRKGHRELTRQGFWKGGKPPYGYRGVKADNGKHTRLEPDPVHGLVMAKVFEMVAVGARSQDVMAFITAKTGERWQWQTFYARLKNPVYHGLLEYGKTSLQKGRHRLKQGVDEVVQGSVPAIVTEELWREANAKVEERQVNSTRGRTPKRVYLLSEGVATCACCDRNFTGSTWHGSRVYVCSGRKNELCAMKNKVFADELEAAVYQVFTEELQRFDIEGFIESYAASLAPRLDEARHREAKLRKDLTEVRKKVKNLVGALAQGIAVDDIRAAMEELKGEEKVLAEEIALCQLAEEQSVKLNVELVKSYVSSFGDLVPELTPEELKEFLQRNLRIEWDLEKQEGQLYLKLTPDSRRSVNLDTPRKPYGRSARI